uniref:Uncharacterized protein n=1 Tax=viral metagenome TaxID=1070528 RepID=A0A6M3LWW1_9ZZZZ
MSQNDELLASQERGPDEDKVYYNGNEIHSIYIKRRGTKWAREITLRLKDQSGFLFEAKLTLGPRTLETDIHVEEFNWAVL